MSNKHFGFTGFKLGGPKPGSGNNSKVPPSYSVNSKKLETSGLKPNYGPSFSSKHLTEESYFESAEDEDDMPTKPIELEYQPAPDSPTYNKNNNQNEDEEDDDPLDEFMAGIEVSFLKNVFRNFGC